MIVYITRHGQPAQRTGDQEADHEFPPGDPPLSALGREQAQLLGEHLRTLGFGRFAHQAGTIYASPYCRTAETADAIAEALDRVFHPERALREVVKTPSQMTDFEGLTLEGLARAYSRVAPDAALSHPWWTLEAETSEMVLARMRPFLDHLIEEKDGDVLLVGHGASVGASTRYFLESRPDVLASLGPGWNCALTAIRVKPRMELLLLRDSAHLDDHQITSNAKTHAMWERERSAHSP